MFNHWCKWALSTVMHTFILMMVTPVEYLFQWVPAEVTLFHDSWQLSALICMETCTLVYTGTQNLTTRTG